MEQKNLLPEDIYEKDIDIANHYDNLRNYEKTIEYSMKVVKEDPSDLVCLTKIVYWTSFFKDYNTLFELLNIIRDSRVQISKVKEIFYRENKFSLKELIVKYYIDCIKKQDELGIIYGKHSEILENFYKLYNDWDLYAIYDGFLNEKSKFVQMNENYNNL